MFMPQKTYKGLPKNRATFISVLFPYLIILSAALLSVLRQPALVYVQIILFIICALSGNRKLSVIALIAVVYGSYSAPMDNELRFAVEYPSIHTMAIFGPLKGIDIILATMVIFNVKRLNHLLRKINLLNALLFGGALILGLMSTGIYQLAHPNTVDVQYFLYITRGLLFFMIAVSALSSLSRQSLLIVINCAIFSCLILMLLSHIFPPENFLSRELFGLNLKVVFAGDEYGTIGILIASLLLVNPKYKMTNAYAICFLALTLALLAGRKSAIGYFSFVSIMIFAEKVKNSSSLKWFLQLEFIAPFLVLTIVASSNADILRALFVEPLGIFQATIDSIGDIWQSSYISSVIGIGPFSKYPLYGINPIFDHQFSFGQQAAELYKIKLWFIPYERAFLNFGLASCFIYLFFILSARKSRPACFYITSWLLYFLLLNPVSSLTILSLALGYSAIKISSESQHDFTRVTLLSPLKGTSSASLKP